jgi:hypothetical protein
MPYATGKHSRAMCARCGHKVRYKTLKQEWTGLWVCQVCFEPKHEQLEPREWIWDPQSLDHPYVDRDDDGTVDQQLSEVISMTHGDT